MRPDNELALSDVVGTSMMLVVTVVAVGAAALAFSNAGGDEPSPPRLDVIGNATGNAGTPPAGDGFVSLRHAGGASTPYSMIQAVVSTPSWTTPYRGPLTPSDGTSHFGLGSTAYVRYVGNPVPPGEDVSVLLYYGTTGLLIAETGFTAASPAPSGTPVLDDFTLDVATPSATSIPAGGALALIAGVEHPDGRKSVDRVVIDLSPVNGPSEVPLHDDGTMGDATAGDGIYAGYVQIPLLATPGSRTLAVYAYDLDGNRNEPTASAASIAITVLSPPGGANGANGANGGNGGAGLNGQDGAPVSLTGPQGPPGSGGTPGATGPTGPGGTVLPEDIVDPIIDAMVPTFGPPGTIVTLTGDLFIDVDQVTLAIAGSSIGYTAQWGPDPASDPGKGIIFRAPNIPDGVYVVTVSTMSGGGMTAPSTFTLIAPQPVIDSVDPPQASSYTVVTVRGSGFSTTSAVTLESATVAPVAVLWTVISDGELHFVTHPGLPVGIYDLVVTAGFKSDTAEFAFEVILPPAPSNLAISPSSARVETLVTITGDHLDSVTRVAMVLPDGSRILDTDAYFDAGALKFAIPTTAAPNGAFNVDYFVDLTGGFVGSARAGTLTVLPTPAPGAITFTPSRGEPFTQVDIFGSNFVNVQSVTFGETAVYFAEVDSGQLLAVTHNGLAPGFYTIRVTTATGSVTSVALFEALPLKLTPIYDKDIFEWVGAKLDADRGTNNDPIDTWLKFKLKPGYSVAAGSASVTFNPVNFEPQAGGNPYTAMTKVCGTTGGINLYRLLDSSLHNYLSPANELDFVYGVKVTGPTSETTYIFTNDETQNFILPANTYTMTVLDNANPTNGFTDCS